MSTDSHTLHTAVVAHTELNTYSVYWRVGGRVGVIDISTNLAVPLSDGLSAAELITIQYLLSDKEVMGNNRTGKGLILDVSRGAVRKIVLGSSSKKDLMPWAIFLMTRYHEATITVAKKVSWIPSTDEDLEHDQLNVSEPRIEAVTTPCFGRVAITKHAIDQYEERFNEGALCRTWSSLVKRIQNPELARVLLPDKVLQHKQRAYGDKDPEVWRHPDGQLHFVVVDAEQGLKVLVTVYYRTESTIIRPHQATL